MRSLFGYARTVFKSNEQKSWLRAWWDELTTVSSITSAAFTLTELGIFNTGPNKRKGLFENKFSQITSLNVYVFIILSENAEIEGHVRFGNCMISLEKSAVTCSKMLKVEIDVDNRRRSVID